MNLLSEGYYFIYFSYLSIFYIYLSNKELLSVFRCFFMKQRQFNIYAIVFTCEAAWWRTAFSPCLQCGECECKSRRSASVDMIWSNSACKSTGRLCIVGMGQMASCSSILLMLWVLLKCAEYEIVWGSLLVIPKAVSRIQGLCCSI